MPTATAYSLPPPPATPRQQPPGSSNLKSSLPHTGPASYSSIEALLLFHHLTLHGVTPNAWQAISNIIAANPLVQQLDNFDRSRLTPEALREYFLVIVRQREPDLSALTNGAINTVIQNIARRLYEEYKAALSKSIREDEAKIQLIDRDIADIKSGKYDAALAQQLNSINAARTPGSNVFAQDNGPLPSKPLQLPQRVVHPGPPGPPALPPPPQASAMPPMSPIKAPMQSSPMVTGPSSAPPMMESGHAPSTPRTVPPMPQHPPPNASPIAPGAYSMPVTPGAPPVSAGSAPSTSLPQSTTVSGRTIPTAQWQSPAAIPEQDRLRPPGLTTPGITSAPRPNIPASQFSPVLPQPHHAPITSGPYVPITPTSRMPPLSTQYRIPLSPQPTAPPLPPTQASPQTQQRGPPSDASTTANRQQQMPGTPAPVSIPQGTPSFRTPMTVSSPSALYHPAIPTLIPPNLRNPAVDRTPRRPKPPGTAVTPSPATTPSTPVPPSLVPAPVPAVPEVSQSAPNEQLVRAASQEPPKSPPRPTSREVSPISPSNSPPQPMARLPILDTPAAAGAKPPPTTPYVKKAMSEEETKKLQEALVMKLLASSKKAPASIKAAVVTPAPRGVTKRSGRSGSRRTPTPNVRTRRSASAEVEQQLEDVGAPTPMEGIEESPAVKKREDVDMTDAAETKTRASKRKAAESPDSDSDPDTTPATRSGRAAKSTAASDRPARSGRRRTPRAETPAAEDTDVPGEAEAEAPPTAEKPKRGRPRKHPLPDAVPKEEPSEAQGLEAPLTPTPRGSVPPKFEISNSAPSPSPFRPTVVAGQQPYVVATKRFAQISTPLLANISGHKFASLFSNPVRESTAPGYYRMVKQPQDLKSIKTAIKAGATAVAASTESSTPSTGTPTSGSTYTILPATNLVVPPKGIVNSAQLEKEIFRMFANAVMYNKSDSQVAREAHEMSRDIERIVFEFRNAERMGEEAAGRRREREEKNRDGKGMDQITRSSRLSLSNIGRDGRADDGGREAGRGSVDTERTRTESVADDEGRGTTTAAARRGRRKKAA